jgi:hypothetical protein
MDQIWVWLGEITGLKNIDTGSATLVGGLLALGAGVLAWFAVQRQIKEQRIAEDRRAQHERQTVERALIAEMVCLSSSMIGSVSQWHHRLIEYPGDQPARPLPVFMTPVVYQALVHQLGVIREPWIVGAIISFYGNLLEINTLTPADQETIGDIVDRLRVMSLNLAEALYGLNEDRGLNISEDIRLGDLYLHNGATADTLNPVPENLQDLLRALVQRA